MVGAIIADAVRGFRRQLEQRLDRAGGCFARAQLENLAEQYEDRDDSGGLKIDRNRAAMSAEGCRNVPGAMVPMRL